LISVSLDAFVNQGFTRLLQRFGFYSLKTRLLVPLSVAALVAAAAMVILSFMQGKRWAMEEVRDRFSRIEQTLRESTFPLSRNVLGTLAELTASNMITVGENNELLWSTLPLQPAEQISLAGLIERRTPTAPSSVEPIDAALPLANRSYLTYLVARKGGRSEGVKPTDAGTEFVGQAGVDGVAWLLVLFDRELVEASRASRGTLSAGDWTIHHSFALDNHVVRFIATCAAPNQTPAQRRTGCDR
jgi:putative flippase GtrA